ncbi:MAG: EF-hand domain-containing protein [Afipia sp.]|nr:EF-hand domain-containing protein [Afipia sp.]
MYLALAGAASSALDLLSSLTPGKSGSAAKAQTGLTQNTTTSFGLSTPATSTSQTSGSAGVAQSGALSPQTLSALFAAQDPSQSSSSTSRSDALKDLFSKLDSNGDGQISKSEFESNLGAGGTNTANADSVFGKLDTNGDGSVSLDELSAALKGKGGGHGHHHAHGAGGGKGGQDALLQALDGASSTSTTNSDGSTTTTMTYSDGTTVTMNSPAAASKNSSASNSASSSYNLVEKMIQKQADALALSAKHSLSVSV